MELFVVVDKVSDTVLDVGIAANPGSFVRRTLPRFIRDGYPIADIKYGRISEIDDKSFLIKKSLRSVEWHDWNEYQFAVSDSERVSPEVFEKMVRDSQEKQVLQQERIRQIAAAARDSGVSPQIIKSQLEKGE